MIQRLQAFIEAYQQAIAPGEKLVEQARISDDYPALDPFFEALALQQKLDFKRLQDDWEKSKKTPEEKETYSLLRSKIEHLHQIVAELVQIAQEKKNQLLPEFEEMAKIQKMRQAYGK